MCVCVGGGGDPIDPADPDSTPGLVPSPGPHLGTGDEPLVGLSCVCLFVLFVCFVLFVVFVVLQLCLTGLLAIQGGGLCA